MRLNTAMPSYFDDWKQREFACSSCSWRGPGISLVEGEAMRGGEELLWRIVHGGA
jgi:hypothetical protein